MAVEPRRKTDDSAIHRPFAKCHRHCARLHTKRSDPQKPRIRLVHLSCHHLNESLLPANRGKLVNAPVRPHTPCVRIATQRAT
ncbi:unnamed protein product [Mesocestoides corti]|uniref:Uncharacterized protein n=1 Tax=Mesocestoides corti TaxID=53468 RepID=A0A0R3UM81_MESCO|nr:unnamed protein product [Mesocestoides corti]